MRTSARWGGPRQGLGGLVLPAAATVLLALVSGCSHKVEPTAGYTDPEDIPVVANLRAEVSAQARSVQLFWEAGPEIFAIIDGWAIDRAEVVDGEPGPFTRLNRDLRLELDFIDSTINGNVLYEYQVRSVTPAGVESLPVTVRVTADFLPPAPPVNLRVVEVSVAPPAKRVHLEWDPSPDDDVQFYHVFRLPSFRTLTFIELPAVTTFLDDSFDLEPLLTYRYFITAVDFAGNEGIESEVAVITLSGNP